MQRPHLLVALILIWTALGVTMADERYASRREALMERVPHGVTLVRGGGADGINWNFFYLTGIHEPGASLLLAPTGTTVETGRRYPGPNYVRGRRVRQVLFLPEGDALAAVWGEDSAFTLAGARAEELGVDAVYGSGQLEAVLTQALGEHSILHVVRGFPPTLSGNADPDAAFVERVRGRFFGTQVRDATDLVEEMRRLKDDGEVAAVQRAIDVTGQALEALMKLARPGSGEYELEAELTRHYRGANGGHAFSPIVAAGANACLLHYKENSGRVADGDLVLIDTGAALDGYKADISRTFPVGGRFTARQREVYQAVLEAQAAAFAASKPGANLSDVHEAAWASIEKAGFGEYFIHGTSHFLGLETHDVGDRLRPFEAGALFTIEPGIYIPDEALGVRIEDVVVITEDGARLMSSSIPRTIEEIEALMAR